MLLATQVNNPLVGVTASANASSDAVGKYEVSLKTNTSSPVLIAGAKKPDYEAQVLAPLHAAQADAARKQAEAEAATASAAAAAAQAKAQLASVRVVTLTPGSHTDWMREAGIAESDFGYVDYIIDHESGWGVTKYNYGGSGAYGLGQALPATKMAAFGSDYMSNPVTQLKWANAYAISRYGSWAGAYSYWTNHHVW